MVKDKKPYIEVKKARIARAGKQVYSADEIYLRGLKPISEKDAYIEYRPAEIVIKNLDKFNLIPFVNDHTPEDVTQDNWKEYAVGMIGSNASIEVTDDNEIFVVNDVVFYEKAAYDDYKAGKVELSAGYDAESKAVDFGMTGYDFELTGIPAVNHVALCNTARAGHNARIIDSLSNNNIEKIFGGKQMGAKSRILSALGIGKTADKDFSLSKLVMDSVKKVGTLGEVELKKEVTGVMSHVSSLGDSETKESLIASIADSFKHPVEVLAQKDKVAKIIDGLYKKCLDADEEAAKKELDEIEASEDEKKKEEEEENEKKKASASKDAVVTDTAAIIDEAVKKAISSVEDKMGSLVDKAVKDALGLKADSGAGSSLGSSLDSALDSYLSDDGDSSYLLKGTFGLK